MRPRALSKTPSLVLVVIDLGQGIKPVFSQHDIMATLLEENFGATANRIAVVYDQNSDMG